jgi:tripartite-type tricarboxylate transporter receptor subunit TctC
MNDSFRNEFSRRHLLRAGLALPALLALPRFALAQPYPEKPVKMIVPYPAGGSTDILPRIMQDWLTSRWKQPIVVENKPGAAGNIGVEAAYVAQPDGYTVLITAPSPMTVNQSLYPKLNFVPSEFVPISILATIPTALIVSNRMPANNFKEFIAYAKANPGKLTAATQGTGTTSHLTLEWFQMVTETKLLAVPYRGSGPALTDMMGGSVDVMFDNLGTSLQLVRNGQLKMLAVATDKRMPDLPDTPTMAETLPNFVSSTWVGGFLPPKSPQEFADKLNADFNEAIKQADIVKRFRDNGCEPLGTTPKQTADFVNAEREKWSKVIQVAGIKLN